MERWKNMKYEMRGRVALTGSASVARGSGLERAERRRALLSGCQVLFFVIGTTGSEERFQDFKYIADRPFG